MELDVEIELETIKFIETKNSIILQAIDTNSCSLIYDAL